MKKMALLALMVMGMVCGCSKEDKIPDPTLKLEQNEITLVIGEKRTIAPVVTNNPDDALPVTWETADNSIVTVRQIDIKKGEITAKAIGETSVTATLWGSKNNASDVCRVIVIPKSVTGLTMSLSEVEIGAGITFQLSAAITPSDATNREIKWESSDTDIARVDSRGMVTTVKEGACIITATTADGGFKTTCTVTVMPVKAEGVKLDKATLKLGVGDTEELAATVSPADAKNKAVKWSSSNTSVATVDANGLVKGVAVGIADITVTTDDGGHTASCRVEVLGVTSLVTTRITGTYSSFNYRVTGYMEMVIYNGTSKPIKLISFTLKDYYGKVLGTLDNSRLGTLDAKKSASWGMDMTMVYDPTFIYVYEYEGKQYTISKSMSER